MASLITSGEAAALTGIFSDIFDTFKRNVVIWKEPIRTVATINDSFLYGYDYPSNPVNYTNTPVSGIFEAVVKYNDNMDNKYDADVNSYFPEGYVRIKVKPIAKNFIENGKTERIDFDGKSFNIESETTPKLFLGNEYYVYHLKEIR
jgi:hypothetical protein